MELKPRPNHQRYLQVLRRMTPAERAAKAFELSAFARRLFLDGLRNRHPELTDAQLHELALKRQMQCHNRNY